MTVLSGTWPKMTSSDEFRFLSELVMTRSSADHTIVSLRDHHAGTTRFANNQVIQNVDARRGTSDGDGRLWRTAGDGEHDGFYRG